MAVDTMTAYERALIRSAMLDAQSEWLNEAEKAEKERDEKTSSIIARVIADAFLQEASKYKEETETKGHEDAWFAQKD
jgi:hypothetical protein